MRDHLVQTSEAARHPFRAILPPAVLAAAMPAPPRPRGEDIRLFLLTFASGFLATYTFIV